MLLADKQIGLCFVHWVAGFLSAVHLGHRDKLAALHVDLLAAFVSVTKAQRSTRL